MNIEICSGLGCKLVRGEPGIYGHTFGGDIQYGGTIPEACFAPVHLLFRLDLTDPNLPFKAGRGFRFLPFFFAFNYDASAMSYRVCADNEIEIINIDTIAYLPAYPELPQQFMNVPISVQSITYEEQRDLAMVWYLYIHPEIYDALPQAEVRRFGRQGYPVTRIGRTHDLLQLPRGDPCPDPTCENFTEPYSLQTIATIPEKPFSDLDLWQSDGSSVQIVYEICKLCGSIRTYSTYD